MVKIYIHSTQRFVRGFMMTALCVLLWLAGSQGVQSQPSPNRRSSKVGKLPHRTISQLYSSDRAVVHNAIDKISRLKKRNSVAQLAAFVTSGQPDSIADHVIEALGRIGSPKAIPILKQLLQHRRPGARQRAYSSLAAIHHPDIPPIIAQGLRDSSPLVRSTAAKLLGNIGATQFVELLFWAFSKGMDEASSAIGQLGGENSIERFSKYIERKPIETMLLGYQQFLQREDIDERAKLDIVVTLGEVSGQRVKRFFQNYLSHYRTKNHTALYRAIRTAIERIPTPPLIRAPNID